MIRTLFLDENSSNPWFIMKTEKIITLIQDILCTNCLFPLEFKTRDYSTFRASEMLVLFLRVVIPFCLFLSFF